MDPKQNKMAVMPEGKLLFSMAFPIILSMLIQALYNVVDSIYVSQIGEHALTAVSLGTPIQGLMISLAVGTGVGINSILSRRMGQRRYRDAEKVCSNALFIEFCSWIPFLIFGLFFAGSFINGFTDDAEIARMGTEYISICAVFSFGTFLSIAMERIMQAFGDSIFQMVTQASGAILNIILDPIFIFGWFGLPAMGTAGAAIATVTGQITGTLIAVTMMFKKKKPIRVSLRGFRPEWKSIKDIYQVGLPSIIMQSISPITTIGLNSILMPMTSTAVAVFGVYFKLQNFIFMPVFGLNNGLVPIVGFNYGARNRKRIMRTLKLSMITAVCIMTFGTFLLTVFPDQLLLLFNAKQDMMDIGRAALRIISLSFPLAGVSISVSGVFQATGDGIHSMLASIFRQLVIILPVAYLLSLTGNLDLVWFSFLIAEVLGLILSMFLFKRTYNRKLRDLSPTEFDRPVPSLTEDPESVEL